MTSGPALRHLTGATPRWPPTSTGCRAIQYFGATRRRLVEERNRGPEPPRTLAATPRRIPQPMPVARHHDIARSPLQHRLSLRRGVPGGTAPGGPGRPDLAIKLLEKGLAERPDKWEYMEDIGFVHYWYPARLPAGRRAGSGRPPISPKRPGGCSSLAATTLAQGGDRASSRADVAGRFASRPKSTGCVRTPSGAWPSCGVAR